MIFADCLCFPWFFVICWSRVIFGKAKIALVITPRLDWSIRAHRKPRTRSFKTQVVFECRPSQPVALPICWKPTFFANIDLIFVPRPIHQVENYRKWIILLLLVRKNLLFLYYFTIVRGTFCEKNTFSFKGLLMLTVCKGFWVLCFDFSNRFLKAKHKTQNPLQTLKISL